MPGRAPDAASAAAPSPAAQGYRWPAEWEPHAATWLAWPHNVETWPDDGRLLRAERAYVEMVSVLQGRETVCINAGDEALEARARRRLAEGGVDADRGVRFHRIASDDAWVRDHGPVFVVRRRAGARERALVDFRFDSWGRKYPPWDRDDAVACRIAEALRLPRFPVDFVLEGGSIDGDGAGTVLVTETCLLNPNRGAGRTRERVERVLGDALGARAVVWLGGGIEGDDTDGHVDDVARFVAPRTVVAAVEPDAADANHAPLVENARRLRGLRDASGARLEVVTLPMPAPRFAAGARLPASHANFYLANGVALVPTFGGASDARALAILRELLPDREVVGIDCSELVSGLGAVHCLTQQEPA